MKNFLLLLSLVSTTLFAAPSSNNQSAVKTLKNGASIITVPNVGSDTMVLRNSLETLTQKSMDGGSNTFTNLPLSSIGTGLLPVANGGTNLASGTSGGILGYTAAGVLASSGALTANQLIIGGGAGATPSALAAGSQYQPLVMGVSNPGYGALNLAQGAATTGALLPTRGGTGVASVTTGDLLIGTGANTWSNLAAGTTSYVLTSNGGGVAPSWQLGGSGGGSGPNYITNPGAEVDTSGWATYADAAGVTPVDGTGGSPTVTWTRTTSTPLANVGSFLITKDAANRQGEGASFAFTIDNAQQAKVLAIDFDYVVASGTFVAGSNGVDSDIEIYVYDVTNAVLIQPSSYKLFSSTTSPSSHFSSTFQTASNSTSYRLIFHTATTSANAYTVKFDTVTVAPSKYVYGTPITAWSAYTPTLSVGFGTATNISYTYRRVGDSVEVQGTHTNGTAAASIGSISLPAGLSIDTTKMSIANTTSNPGPQVGFFVDNIGSSDQGPIVTCTGTSATVVYIGGNQTSATKLTPANVSTASGSTGVISIKFSVPVLGWGGTVQMSDTANSQLVVTKVQNSATITGTTSVPFIFATVAYDKTGSYNVSTGQYTVPVAGVYRIYGALTGGGAVTASIYLYVNTVQKDNMSISNSGAGSASISTSYEAKAGDLLEIRPSASWTLTGNSSTALSSVTFERISGPQTIAATETIAASYYVSANFSASTTIPINFDTKELDTHGAVTTSATAFKFTAPAAGLYQVSGTSFLNGGQNLFIYKNGSIYKVVGGNATGQAGNYIGQVRLVSGDFIDIRPGGAVTAQGGVLTASTTSTLNIIRLGL